jgi:hypothetical protein
MGRTGGTVMPSGAGYDVFLSYSHSHDDRLAPVLQARLERFAVPWYKPRALRVFRDTGSLGANPELWASIVDAMGASEWFVLLASPDAAQSQWVNDEVRWWLDNRSAERLLVVATAEKLRWDRETGDWAEGTPVPPALRGVFRAEPHWIDLSGARAGDGPARISEEALAALAAPVRKLTPDDIIGEDLRQGRRTRHTVQGVIATLTALLVVAVAAVFVAIGQRDTARTADRIAAGGELAAVSQSLLGSHLDVAGLLAVAGYRTEQDPQTDGALLQAAAAAPQLVRFLPAGAPVTALAGAANGKAVVAGTAGGTLIWFDVKTGRHVEVGTGGGDITSLAVSTDGSAVVAADGTRAFGWTAGAREATELSGMRSVSSVAISPSGRLVAALGEGATSATETLTVRTADEGERTVSLGVPFEPGTDSVGFPSDSSLVLAYSSVWERFDPASLRMTASSTTQKTPGDEYVAGNAENGAYAGFTKGGEITAWPTDGTDPLGAFLTGTAPDNPESFLTIRDDGREAAEIQSGTIAVVPLAQDRLPTGSPTPLTADGDTSLVTFLGTGGFLASAGGSTIQIWNLAQVSRLGAPTGFSVPFPSEAGPPPAMLPTPDGKWLELVAGNGTGTWLLPGDGGPGRAVAPGGVLPLLNGDIPMLLDAAPVDGGVASVITLASVDGKESWSWPDKYKPPGFPISPAPEAAGLLAGRRTLDVVFSDGSVQTFGLANHTVRVLRPGSAATEVGPGEAVILPGGSAAIVSEWTLNTSPPSPRDVVYVDLRTGASHELGSGGAEGVAFSPAGLVIQRVPGALEIWNATGQRLLRSLPGIDGAAGPLAVSPNGTLAARLSSDGVVSITDLTTGNILATFSLPPPQETYPDPWAGTDMVFTPDGRHLLTATGGGELVRWALDSSDLVPLICSTVGFPLTAAQWQQYAGTPPPAEMPCPP